MSVKATPAPVISRRAASFLAQRENILYDGAEADSTRAHSVGRDHEEGGRDHADEATASVSVATSRKCCFDETPPQPPPPDSGFDRYMLHVHESADSPAFNFSA